jgi:hypothetical protein
MAAFDPSRITASFPEKNDDDLHPSADPAPVRAGVLLRAGRHANGRQGTATLRENDGITSSHRQRGIPREARKVERPPGFVLQGTENNMKEMTMNAMNLKAGWRLWAPTAKRLQLRRKQRGFALYDAQRRPGVPVRVANAHARFEYEARQAMREWLML